jgi:predicted alpha/beta hydrolase
MPNIQEREPTQLLAARSRDGAESQLRLFEAENATAVVVAMPAMGIRASHYDPLARELAARGVTCALADVRGHGTSSVRPSRSVDFGYREMIENDWPAAIEAARAECPGRPLFLLGNSMGGQLSCLYMAKYPESVDGLILVAAASVYHASYAFPKSAGILLGSQAARAVADVLGYFPGKRVRFAGTEARTVMRDWAHEARTGSFRLIGSHDDFDAKLAAVERPVLSISVSDDELTTRRGVEHLLSKMPRADIERHHVSPGELNVKRLGHFGWVRHAGVLMATILPWIERQTARLSAAASAELRA